MPLLNSYSTRAIYSILLGMCDLGGFFALHEKRYVYVWTDGIYFNIRDDKRQCILVLIGVTDSGHKELLAKYLEATECLAKDRAALLAFYDFPAEHWVHIRSTNPIESAFATVRLRTDKTRGSVSQDTILSLVFKLVQSAQKRWSRIRGFKHLRDVIEGVQFKDGNSC